MGGYVHLDKEEIVADEALTVFVKVKISCD